MNHSQESTRSETGARDAGESLRATPSGSPARAALLEALAVTERSLPLAGVSTAVLEGGEGAPILLLHGPAANATHWRGVIERLVTHHRVIVPDLPAHGESQAPSARLEAGFMLRWLDELIERTCSSPPAVVGHVAGGAIGARFAIAHSDRLARLVLVDSFGLSEFRPAPGMESAVTEFLTRPTERSHRDLWQYCARDLSSLRNRMGNLWESFEAYNLERARNASQQGALPGLMEAFAGAIPPDELARIAVPTVLIWGRHDLATPLSVAEAASARYGWPLHVIEDANDDPVVEQPEVFGDALQWALRDWTASFDGHAV